MPSPPFPLLFSLYFSFRSKKTRALERFGVYLIPSPLFVRRESIQFPLPKAAAGYARSRFLRADELLRELAPLLVPAPAPAPGIERLPLPLLCMSGGRSFHSVSGRKFWNDWPGVLRLLLGIGFGGGRVAGGGAVAVPVAGREGVWECGCRAGGGVRPGEEEEEEEDGDDSPGVVKGRFAAAAVTLLPGSAFFTSPAAPKGELDPLNPSMAAAGPISRRTIQALSGRSCL